MEAPDDISAFDIRAPEKDGVFPSAQIRGTLSRIYKAKLNEGDGQEMSLRFFQSNCGAHFWVQWGRRELGGVIDKNKEAASRLGSAVAAWRELRDREQISRQIWFDTIKRKFEEHEEFKDKPELKRQMIGIVMASSVFLTVSVSTFAVGDGLASSPRELSQRSLMAINDISDLAYSLWVHTGNWVLCPERLECWDSRSLQMSWLAILMYLLFCLLILVVVIGVDKDESHGHQRRERLQRFCARLPHQALCSVCDKLEMMCGENGGLAVFYLLLFMASGAVQVFGFGYDTFLVLLFHAGIVLALVFVGGMLRVVCPQLYEK